MNYVIGQVYAGTFDDKIVDLLCYDKSEKYAYLAPFIFEKDGSKKINIGHTKVYSIEECDEYPISYIYDFKEDTKK